MSAKCGEAFIARACGFLRGCEMESSACSLSSTKQFARWALSFPSASPSGPRGASLNFVSFACLAYLPLTMKS